MSNQCLSAATKLLALCAAVIVSPIYATNLNPVAWSLHATQEKTPPGSEVVLTLRAQVAEGYHLYSFTTPSGGPIRTTASVHANSDIKDFRVYQPKPNRHQDRTFNIPVETFQGGVDFLVRGELPKTAPSGNTLVTVSVRYQACSDEICLAPVTRIATASITLQSGAPITNPSIPGGYQLVVGSALAPGTGHQRVAITPIDWHFVLVAFGSAWPRSSPPVYFR